MTMTEMMVIGGGLLLGYWLVSVLLPTLFEGKNGKESASKAGEPPYESDTEANDYRNFESEEPLRSEEPATAHSSPLRWFEILEVDESASNLEIEAAYKRQISQYHPDKVARMGIEIRQLAESRSKAINAAYHTATKR